MVTYSACTRDEESPKERNKKGKTKQNKKLEGQRKRRGEKKGGDIQYS